MLLYAGELFGVWCEPFTPTCTGEAINLVNLFQENRLLSLVLMPFTH